MSGTPGERTADHPDSGRLPNPVPGATPGSAGPAWRSLVPGAPSPYVPGGDERADDGSVPDETRDRDRLAEDAASPDELAGRAGTADEAAGDGPPAGDELADGDGARVSLTERVTVRLPRQRPAPGPRRGRAPVLVAASATTVLGALLVWVPVALTVLLVTAPVRGAGLGFAGTVRASLALWLLGHGVPVHAGPTTISLAPLGLSVLAGWRVARAGVHTARAVGARRRGAARPAILAALAVALVYALLGLLAGYLTRHGTLRVDPAEAALRMGGFALVLGGAGAAAEGGLVDRVRRRAPALLRDAVRTGVVAAALVLAAGAGVAGTALAVRAGDASDVLAAYHAGVAGQAGLTLVCLGFAPNLATWSAAYLIGPGFTVGLGTTVSPASVTLGALPALPVLAGLPTTAASGAGVLLLGLPVAAGMVAGGLLVRRRRREADGEPLHWGLLAGTALVAGPVAGALLGIAALVSGGALGAGRLVHLGPVAWQVALIGAGVTALGVLLGGAATAVAIGADRPQRPRGAAAQRPRRTRPGAPPRRR